MSPLQSILSVLFIAAVTIGGPTPVPGNVTKVCCDYGSSFDELQSMVRSMQMMLQQQNVKMAELGDQLILLKSGTAACPNDYVKHGNSCYKVNAKALQQQQALTACQAEGGSLLAIESSEEQQFIEGLLRANSVGGVVWIGGHDRIAEGKWIWESTKAPIWKTFYTNWRDGQPDNRDSQTGAKEECMEFEPDGRWNDVRCDHPASRSSGFICEINI